MERTSFSRMLRVLYRFGRRRTRGLRRMCISILSVALIVDRVIERARELLGFGSCV